MCGIAGIFNLDREDIKHQSLYDMCRKIEHRGPDERGTYFRQNLSMGMQRLSIIDIDNGSQPIHNKQKTVWTVFNGEIYNVENLKKQLSEYWEDFPKMFVTSSKNKTGISQIHRFIESSLKEYAI